MEKITIGIIGGSGLDNPDILENRVEKSVETPFGKPSDNLIIGHISGIHCVLLARHGRKHDVNPTNINYRANIWALKQEGCNCIIVSCAVGSLQKDVLPGDIVILDQFIDKTTKRTSTFYDGRSKSFPGVCHIPMAHPFSNELNEVLSSVTNVLGVERVHEGGTILVIEGPRFSSKAESKMWQSFGASVVGMTTMPEVVLANEAAIPYSAVALVTDMDSWQDTAHVDVETVMKQMKMNADTFKKILLATIVRLPALDWSNIQKKYDEVLKSSIM